MRKYGTPRLAVLTLVALTMAFSAHAGDGKSFEWTTDSKDAVKLLEELQERIENFQFGTETIETAKKVVAADPDFAMGVYYLSAVTPAPGNQEHLDKAVELAKNASDGERRFIETMAMARANNGANFAAAVPILEELGKDYPEERLVQMILGQVYQGSGDGTKARAAFEKALEIGPTSQRARSFIANDNLLRGEYANARSEFQEIQKALPAGAAPAPVRYGVAFSYLYEGKDEAAIKALKVYLDEYQESGAAQNFPEVFIWNSIARIYLENGDTDKALDAYAKGYESVPGSGLPEDQKALWLGRLKHGRCRTLAKAGKFDEARKEMEAIHTMIVEAGEDGEQYMPAYHYLVGYVELEAGNAMKAAEHLKQANPNDPFHTLLLARALNELGEREEAVKAYESIVESTNNGLERALAYPEAKKALAKS